MAPPAGQGPELQALVAAWKEIDALRRDNEKLEAKLAQARTNSLPQPTPMIRPGASGASSKGRKSFEKLALIAQRKSDADGRKDTQ